MDKVGFSKNPQTGVLYLIGIGPQEWLAKRLHFGCTELVMRDPLPGEMDEENDGATEAHLRLMEAGPPNFTSASMQAFWLAWMH